VARPLTPALVLASSLLIACASTHESRDTAPPRTAVDPVEDRVIHVTALLATTPERAFAYFTDVKLVRSWLAAEADIEPIIGGKYELFWNPADRENDSTIGCRITALTPNQLIAFEWRSPQQFKELANSADPLTHVVVTFAPEGSRTRVHLVHSGWRTSPEWEDARVWQERAWESAFTALEGTAKD
jgi:uncharacterized protein YndB with AHSA1/START domain